MIGAHAYFRGSGNIRLHYRCWDATSPRAVVVVSHGLGEHSGRYQRLASDLARAGLSTYALDHRGHGRSDGRRGHVRRFGQYVQDLERFRRRVVGSVGPRVPLIFLGQSLGGLVVIRYLQEYPGVPVAGAILSAPLLGIAIDAPRWKVQLGRILTHAIPALPMSTGLDPADLSHDDEVVEDYERDPLVHDRITPRLYSEIKSEIEVAQSKSKRVIVPTLFLLPSADRIVRPDTTQKFVASLPASRQVELRTYPGLYHEPLNETARSRVIADVLGWLEGRVEAKTVATGVDSGSGSNESEVSE